MSKNIIGYIVGIVGLFFAVLPHSVHLSLGLTFDHIYHVILGIILLAIAAWLLFGKKPA